jgi:adenylate cyclase
MLRFGRSMFGLIPSAPRCKLCYAPFSGLGGRLMKLLGKGPWERNPSICRNCFSSLSKMGVGGTEVEVSLVFADVRGSTSLAERMSPREFSELINGFFRTATDVFVKHDGIMDQLVGDEAIGLFFPGFSGPHHSRAAIDAGRMLVDAMAESRYGGISLPIGVGVHTGIAYVGAVGSSDSFRDFTVLGDAVNTTARLAASAAAGEVVVSDASRRHAGIELAGVERRHLTLKGKAEPLDVVVFGGKSMG